MSDFMANEIATIDDRDLPWINNKIKSFIKNMDILKIVSNQIILFQKDILNKFRMLFKNTSKFLSKSIIRNFLENLQLIKLIPNVIGSY